MVRTLLSLFIVLVVVSSLQAGVLVATSFEGYTSGSELSGALSAKPGDVGLSTTGGWNESNAAASWVVTGKTMSYSVSGGGVINGGSQALLWQGDNNKRYSYIPLNTAITAKDFYFRCLVEADGTLNNGATAQLALERTGAEMKYHSGGGLSIRPPGQSDFFVSNQTTTSSIFFGGSDIASGTTHLVIGKFTWDSVNNKYSQVSLWADPAFVQGAPSVTQSMILTVTSVSDLIVHGGLNGAADPKTQLYVDAIVYGDTWEDVIPEPATMSLLGIGIVGLLRRK
jgi:hypothetical protein